MTTELVNVRTDTQGETVEGMIEPGIVIEVTGPAGEIEMIGVSPGGMPGVMIMIAHQEGIEIFLKGEWIEEAEAEDPQEMIEMNLRSKWVEETGRKARVRRRRRKSLRLTLPIRYLLRNERDD